MNLHVRIVEARLDEAAKVDRFYNSISDKRRLARLDYLARKTADRWRRIAGYTQQYYADEPRPPR